MLGYRSGVRPMVGFVAARGRLVYVSRPFVVPAVVVVRWRIAAGRPVGVVVNFEASTVVGPCFEPYPEGGFVLWDKTRVSIGYDVRRKRPRGKRVG